MKAKTLSGRSAFSKLPALKISTPSAKHRRRKFNIANAQARQKAERRGRHARKAAEDLGSAAGAMANKYLGRAEEVWDDALHRVRHFQDDSKQYVRANPTQAVCTALLVGFVLGLIFRR
jgi:ElaB/YqjD/DUF883 family membrane-anchored ribosome-binding protein